MNNEPKVTLVDTADQPRGQAAKGDAHRAPMLHRAFSVFLYHDNQMLIQRRAAEKYHSGGLWSNSCCSHPRPEETLEEAVQNRMQLELGIAPAVEEIFQFTYYCRFREDLYEYEYDHVFIGKFDGQPILNPEEASDARWITLEALERELVERPQDYSVWFLSAAPWVIEAIKAKGKG